MAQQNQINPGSVFNGDQLSQISQQLQECIKNLKYGGPQNKDHPIQKLIPEGVAEEYLRINNLPHTRKWNTLCKVMDEFPLSGKELSTLNSDLKKVLGSFREWEERYDSHSRNENRLTVEDAMDVWLFGSIILPLIRQSGGLLEHVNNFVETLEEEARIEAEVKDESYEE